MLITVPNIHLHNRNNGHIISDGELTNGVPENRSIPKFRMNDSNATGLCTFTFFEGLWIPNCESEWIAHTSVEELYGNIATYADVKCVDDTTQIETDDVNTEFCLCKLKHNDIIYISAQLAKNLAIALQQCGYVCAVGGAIYNLCTYRTVGNVSHRRNG